MARLDPLENLVEVGQLIPPCGRPDSSRNRGALPLTYTGLDTVDTVSCHTPNRLLMTDTRAKATESAYLEAYEKYSDALFRHAAFRISNRERALDIVQDAFLKVWDYIRGGGEVDQYKAFLYRIVNNLIIDEYRKKKSSSLDEILESDTGAMEARLSHGSVRETEEEFDERDMLVQIRAHIPRLPDTYREVITMRYIDGFTPKEIAAMIGISENVVSVRIHRGTHKLRTLCKSDLHNENTKIV